MEVILDKIANGTDFGMDELVTICEAFSKVGEGGHSAQLRIAIGTRLQQEDKLGPLVAPESVEMEPDSENEHDVVDID